MDGRFTSPRVKSLSALPLAAIIYGLLAKGMIHLPGVAGRNAELLHGFSQFSHVVAHFVTVYCLVLLVLFVRLRESFFSYFSWQKPDLAAFSWMIWALGLLGLGVVAVALSHPHALMVMQSWEQALAGPLLATAWALLMLLIVFPLLEEVVFRGLLLGLIAKSELGSLSAVLITTYLWVVPFSLSGGALLALNFVVGLMLAAARQRSGSLPFVFALRLLYSVGMLVGFALL